MPSSTDHAQTDPIPTDPEGRPLYPADIADLDPGKVFAAGLHLPVRVEEDARIGCFLIVDADNTRFAHLFVGPVKDGSDLSPVQARGLATAIAKAINTLGNAA